MAQLLERFRPVTGLAKKQHRIKISHLRDAGRPSPSAPRNTRVRRTAAVLKKSEQARKTDLTPKPDKTKAQTLFQGQNHPKKQRRLVILDQWFEIESEDGRTITTAYPSNEKLIEEGKGMLPPPELVYRRLNFPNGVPPEYYWATQNPEARELGGTGIQRMTVDTWLEVIEREAAEGTGHIGPTGVGTLPRPVEHGICECQVCTRNARLMDLEDQKGES
jgi:hypothetical protein